MVDDPVGLGDQSNWVPSSPVMTGTDAYLDSWYFMCPVGKILQQHDFRKNQVFAILPIKPNKCHGPYVCTY